VAWNVRATILLASAGIAFGILLFWLLAGWSARRKSSAARLAICAAVVFVDAALVASCGLAGVCF
jgi:hypothetical protein